MLPVSDDNRLPQKLVAQINNDSAHSKRSVATREKKFLFSFYRIDSQDDASSPPECFNYNLHRGRSYESCCSIVPSN